MLISHLQQYLDVIRDGKRGTKFSHCETNTLPLYYEGTCDQVKDHS